MDISSMTLEQFNKIFSTEQSCAEYLFNAKWPEGFMCPRCSFRDAYKTVTRRLPLYECKNCHYQASLTSGTIFEGSRTHLSKWMLALFLISRTDKRTSAVELAKVINVTYKTAWLILHKIRHAMSSADATTLLYGSVRVNSAAYGKPYNPSFHNHPQEHPLLIGAAYSEHGQPSYVKIKLVSRINWRHRQVTPCETRDFRDHNVAAGTNDIQIITGRFHPNRFRELLTIVNKASNWINTTFHGLGSKHLQAYMDEFAFRVNALSSSKSIFSFLAHICAATPSVTYLSITQKDVS